VEATASAGPGYPDGRPSEDRVAAAVTAFTLLAEPTRLRILWALSDGAQHDVITLAGLAGVPATVASQHLSKLRLAGLVTARRTGRHVHYSTRGGHVRRLLAEALFDADHALAGEPDHD
jgi:DNA-binding transcriptional ArsR family regulator